MDYHDEDDGLCWQDMDHGCRQTERLTVASTGSTRLTTGKLRKSNKNNKRKKRSTIQTEESRKKKKNERTSPIRPLSLLSHFPVGFFNDGNGIGCQLFESRIRAFLSVRDVGACAMTCRALATLCPTYTVPELLRGQRGLENHQLSPRKQRITLDAVVMRLVTTYHREQDRPTRCCWVTPENPEYDILVELMESEVDMKIYHPEELPKVQLLMKEFLQGFKETVDNDSQCISQWSSNALFSYCLRTFYYPDFSQMFETDFPYSPTFDMEYEQKLFIKFWFDQDDSEFLSRNWVLISAFLDDMDSIMYRSAYNVTHIIRMLIQYDTCTDGFLDLETKEERLVLTPPAHDGYEWWYTRLLGDACPGVTKTLVIFARDADSGIIRPFFIHENTRINFPLKAGRDDEFHDKTE